MNEPYMWANLLDDFAPNNAHMTTKDVPLPANCIGHILLTEDDIMQLCTGHVLYVEVNGDTATLAIGWADDSR